MWVVGDFVGPMEPITLIFVELPGYKGYKNILGSDP